MIFATRYNPPVCSGKKFTQSTLTESQYLAECDISLLYRRICKGDKSVLRKPVYGDFVGSDPWEVNAPETTPPETTPPETTPPETTPPETTPPETTPPETTPPVSVTPETAG